MSTEIVIKTFVKDIVTREHRIAGTDEKEMGYFVWFEGLWESIFVGTEIPEFTVGEEMEIVIRKPRKKDKSQ